MAGGQNKKALFHSFLSTKWDKTKLSCGTTQIDALRPLLFAYHHTRRPDNGCGPRRSLLTFRCSLRPHKAIPSQSSHRDPTIRGSLQGLSKRYYSYSLVCFGFNLSLA